MTEESWNLSQREINQHQYPFHVMQMFEAGVYVKEDVQEFIRRLKEEYKTEWSFIKFIDKLAGSKLNQGGKDEGGT